MDIGSVIILLVIIILIILSAFFSSAETAMMSSNRIRIRNMADEGDKRAKLLLKVLENNQSKLLSTILIGNNIVNIVISSLTTILAQRLWGSYAISIATAVITLILLIFGEITPKTSASVNPEKMALRYIRIIYPVTIVFTPIIFVVNGLAFCIMKLLGIDTSKSNRVITEGELRSIVDVSHEEGVLESEEKDIINNLIDFGDDTAKDVMVPWVSVTTVSVDCTYNELMEAYEEEHFTRMPVFEGDDENIIGIINMKDLIGYIPNENFNIRNFIRETGFTFEGKALRELMLEMKRTAVNMMIVLDEYGEAAGIITLEDLLEELVGDIRDEFDEDEFEEIKKIKDNQYIVEGQTKLDDINDHLKIELLSEEYDSIGGFIIEKLDRLPKKGDVVFYNNIKLEVVSMEGHRIEKVKLVFAANK